MAMLNKTAALQTLSFVGKQFVIQATHAANHRELKIGNDYKQPAPDYVMLQLDKITGS